ncbi:MAG: hypothetical protein RLZZ385_1444 [Pseudomonadota bacterium]|jgi:hypothetical protein
MRSRTQFFITHILVMALSAIASASFAQVGGSLIEFPPLDIELQITETADGKPMLDVEEIHLVTGEYYRLNITSTGQTDWRLELADLLQNSHLRVVTINGIEVHLQAMVFRAIEFDQPGTASFSFTPIAPGTYRFTVGRNPIAQGLERGQAGVQEADRRAEGLFVVE